MITDGWGRDLLPPDNAPDSQAGAQGGAAEQADEAQEVQLPEYKGWSQGTRNPGNGSGSGVPAPRGGCLGARPKIRRVAPNQVTPSAGGRAAQGGRPGGPNKERCASPLWSCTSPDLEEGAVGTQNGATPEKTTRSEPPTRSKARALELAWIGPRKSRATRRQQETASAQATVTGSGESTRPTSVDGARRPPDAEAGTHDGGDDTWHVTGPWLWHQR